MEESNRRVLQPWRYLYPTTVAKVGVWAGGLHRMFQEWGRHEILPLCTAVCMCSLCCVLGIVPIAICTANCPLQYNSRVAELDEYLLGIIRTRWAARAAGDAPEKQGRKGDILDRILQNIEVCL